MSASPYFNLEQLPTATVVTLRLAADLDIEVFNEVNAQLVDQWPVEAGQDVIIDLTACRYMGSVLLGLLINVRQRVRASGGNVVVTGASPRLVQVFRTANLDRLIPVAQSREQALGML